MCQGGVPSLHGSPIRISAPCWFLRGAPLWIPGSPVGVGGTSLSGCPSPCSLCKSFSFFEQSPFFCIKVSVLYMPSWGGICLRSPGGQGLALRPPPYHCRISLSGFRGRCSVIVCEEIMGKLLVSLLGGELVSQPSSWKAERSGRKVEGSLGLDASVCPYAFGGVWVLGRG